jgi:hypothetical protein
MPLALCDQPIQLPLPPQQLAQLAHPRIAVPQKQGIPVA